MFSKFLKHVVPGVIRPLHALWNQVVGFLFLVFALFAGVYVYRAARDFSGDADSLFRIALPAGFAVVMGFFSLTSFLKARRITRN